MPTCEHPVPDPANDEILHQCIRPATHEMFNTSGKWIPVCDPHGRGRGVPEDRLRPLTPADEGLDAATHRVMEQRCCEPSDEPPHESFCLACGEDSVWSDGVCEFSEAAARAAREDVQAKQLDDVRALIPPRRTGGVA